MAKSRVSFLCRSCGSVQHRWMGKCPDCGAWDSLEEYRLDKASASDRQKGVAAPGADDDSNGAPKAMPIGEARDASAPMLRLSTGIGELDRVLGKSADISAPESQAPNATSAGLVPGSAILLGGDPGIGKSTLALQALGALAARGTRCLYVSSEESAEQVRLRAERLAVAEREHLYVLADTNLARIVEQARHVAPRVIVIDSIQMIYKADLDASPGSVTQLRRCGTELVYLAKSAGIAIVLIGHVTKDGQLAGPRLLEHLVDVVLYFEGDRYHAHRVVRAVKNRFGTTLEIGLFEMGASGLVEVPDGASVAAAALGIEPRAGSVVCPVVNGSRCVLIEIQALTADGFPGNAKRKSSGLDPSRLAMLIAVLEQHGGMRLFDRDVFASAVGGLRVVEPASDLALALAIAGAHTRRALPIGTAAIGEVGLGGEVRAVPQMESRLREAARLGYTRALVPKTTHPLKVPGISTLPIPTVQRAIEELSPLQGAPSREPKPTTRPVKPVSGTGISPPRV